MSAVARSALTTNREIAAMASRPLHDPGARWLPLHTVLGAFPVAFFTGAFLADWIYTQSPHPMWTDFSAWLITGALIVGSLAAAAGIIEHFVTPRALRPRRRSWHGILSIAALVVGFIDILIHSRDGWNSVVPGGITASAIAAVLAIAASWLGTADALRSRDIA